MVQAVNRKGCLPKGVANAGKLGQELLRLAQRARAEGRISEEDWRELPSTPDGMLNLLFAENVEKRIITALLETYK
jgi:hypothetical protein